LKGQWSLILAFLFALLVAVFAVINVESVEVNYLFGTAYWPLILVILTSVFMGGIIVASVGVFRYYRLSRKVKQLEKENLLLKEQRQQTSIQDTEESLSIEKSE
jgi:lipopolysaccharide assembly protein A